MEEITKIKIDMAETKKDISYIKESLINNTDEHKALMKKIDIWIATCDTKFSSKWVETSWIWVLRVIVGTVILAGLSLIIIKV